MKLKPKIGSEIFLKSPFLATFHNFSIFGSQIAIIRPNLTCLLSYLLQKIYCTGCPISIWTILWGCFEVTGWLKIKKINSSEKFMQLPLKVNKEHFLWHQVWPHNDLLLLKTKVQYLWHTYLVFMASNTLAQKGHGQRNN